VVAPFQPLRRRTQTRVDRPFNRSRYDAELVVGGFAGRLRDEIDIKQLTTEVMTAVDRTIQPTSSRCGCGTDRF
jgi:hypothetical protein